MKRISVRIPALAKECLEAQASQHEQTLSAEIRCRLQRDLWHWNDREYCFDLRLEGDSLQKEPDEFPDLSVE